MGRAGAAWGGGRQQPGDFLGKHASPCPRSSVWLLSLLAREQAQWGLCPSPGKPAQLGGVPPRQLESEGRHFLSPLRVCECSERQGEGRGAQRQAPICVPRGGRPSWGMRRERDSRVEAGLSPSPRTRSPLSWSCRKGSLALWLSLPRPSTPLPPQGVCVLAVPCAPDLPILCSRPHWSHSMAPPQRGLPSSPV